MEYNPGWKQLQLYPLVTFLLLLFPSTSCCFSPFSLFLSVLWGTFLTVVLRYLYSFFCRFILALSFKGCEQMGHSPWCRGGPRLLAVCPSKQAHFANSPGKDGMAKSPILRNTSSYEVFSQMCSPGLLLWLFEWLGGGGQIRHAPSQGRWSHPW